MRITGKSRNDVVHSFIKPDPPSFLIRCPTTTIPSYLSVYSLTREVMSAVAKPAHSYEFDVKMTCSGCSGAVTRVLSKKEGVQSFKVDLPTQKVTVEGDIPYEDVLATIKKTGKEVRSGVTVY
ncbi:hypothetical protein BS47DRAFT_682878 [Hydnum rufescens UP504]|uniref:HMA domain-containing protein n=1 Tax=Hydnum rufescens UP504 TaxID=1448309 RepID=A0A9P6B2V5_9AGAM|nr:hypothetical protein BS47DRAFT_682878 [Hydnum rufescens UP504]